MKILAIGDMNDNAVSLKKFSKKFDVHIITFPKKLAEKFTLSENVEIFDSLLISKQVKKINEIKNEYDLCFVISWSAARIAYLAGLNYIMYFVGGDINTPPFIKNSRSPYLEKPIYNLNIIERYFYKKVLDTAAGCITGTEEYHEKLKRFRKDAIRIDSTFVDTTLFNEKIEPINRNKNKFTFLSAQKFGLEKGLDIICEAIKICKTDFEVLQVEWFTQRTPEEKEINKKLLETLPKQIKFIPLIKRKDLAKYVNFADAILGQMRAGILGGIERDASLCRKPILCYIDSTKPSILNGEKIIPPFLPKDNDVKKLAELIDKIVECKEFREKLANDEYEYGRKLHHPEIAMKEWDRMFENFSKKNKSIKRKYFSPKLKLENIFAFLIEKFVYTRTMKEKNINGWGKEEYNKLMK